MGLSTKPNGGHSPIFVSKVTVTKVNVKYNEPSPFNPDIINDVDLEIGFRTGKGHDLTMNIRGSFKKDEVTHAILDWGSAFKIQTFCKVTGLIGEVDDDGKFPEGFFNGAIGKEFYKLDYISGVKDDGSNKYSISDIVGTDPEKLKASFIKQFTEKGYPSNYKPELVDNGETNFPFGANVESKPTEEIF